jgi:hypothetical protein
MTNFSITYNNINNKFTFVNTTYDFSILSTSTCLNILGFGSSTYTSTSLSLTSINCVNVNNIKCINVMSNLITYNINKSILNNNSILCCISVNKPPYSIIEYQNPNNFRTNLFINNISSIKIKLVDDNNNLIDLNGLNFNMTLQLDVEKFTE